MCAKFLRNFFFFSLKLLSVSERAKYECDCVDYDVNNMIEVVIM